MRSGGRTSFLGRQRESERGGRGGGGGGGGGGLSIFELCTRERGESLLSSSSLQVAAASPDLGFLCGSSVGKRCHKSLFSEKEENFASENKRGKGGQAERD